VVPFLIFSHRNDIFSINNDGTSLRKVVSSAGSSLKLDFDLQEQRIYWLDQNRGLLHRMYLNGTRHEKTRAVVKGSVGFVFDWVHKVIFWVNQQKGTIEQTGRNDKRSRVILQGLFHPTLLAIHPSEGLLFWLSNGSLPVIQKADLDGSNVTSIIKQKGAVTSLTVDTVDKKLFWILSKSDTEDSIIVSCSYEGGSVMTVKHLNYFAGHNIVWLSLLSDDIYYSDRKSGSVRRINKYTGKDKVIINLKPAIDNIGNLIAVDTKRSPGNLNSSLNTEAGFMACAAVNKYCVETCELEVKKQQCRCKHGFVLSRDGRHCEDINECALWNHGCTLGCENIPGSYYCTCPEGYILLPDNKACHEKIPCVKNIGCSYGCVQTVKGPVCTCPDRSVLSKDGKSCTGCTSPDNGGCSQICISSRPGTWECKCLPGYNLQLDKKRCLVSGPRPYLMFANVHDIRRINFDGTGYKSILDSQIGRVFALDYDPAEDKVYFAHTALKYIESANTDGSDRKKIISEHLDTSEGLTIDAVNRKLYWTDRGKSHIERSDLDGKNRKIIVQENIIRPRGICVHPLAKKLFWTDTGAKPRIESSNLVGSERMVLIHTDLIWPSGITVDYVSDKLYWCDTKRSVIESSNLDGSKRQSFSQNDVDQSGCADIQCDINAHCVSSENGPRCQCIEGFTGNGKICHDIDECTLGIHSCGENVLCTNTEGNYTCVCTNGLPGTAFNCTGKPVVVECPSSYEGYCLNGGVCAHFQDLEDYGCRCVSGYVGERCQYDDLKSWEKHVTQMKIQMLPLLFPFLCSS
ncbi:hypothetical protein GDO86_000633, partial [Hymenochirus boettgeri]